MKKKLKTPLIVLVIIIVLFVGINLCIKYNNNTKSLYNKNSIYCRKINKLVKREKDFVIFVDRQSLDPNDNETINEFSELHKEINIIRIPREELSKKCLIDIFTKTGINESVNDKKTNITIFYKNGKFSNFITNENSRLGLESFAIKIGFIDAKKIKESIDLDKFKEKIKKEYILILILDEVHRNVLNKSAKEYVKDIDYDVVYSESEKGKEIYEYVKKNYKISNFYPQAIRFKNSKIIKDVEVYDDQASYNELLSD